MCCVFGQALQMGQHRPPKGGGGGGLWRPEWEELMSWGRGPGVAFSPQGGALARRLLSTDLVPSTLRGSGAGTQNETGRCGLRLHGAGLTQKAERDGLATGPGMSCQKLRWRQTAEPSSELMWPRGRAGKGCQAGASSCAGMGAASRLSWPGPGRTRLAG